MISIGINVWNAAMHGGEDRYRAIFAEDPFELWIPETEGTDYVLDGVTGRIAQLIGRYNGNVLAQATDALQPSRTANWRNGRPAVTSDGTQWIGGNYHATLTQPAFKWTVFEFTVLTGGVAQVVHGSTAASTRMQLSTDAATPLKWALTAASSAISSTEADQNKNYALAAFGATDTLDISGTNVISADAGAASEPACRLFTQHTAAAIMTGHIAEHGILNRAASATEKTNLVAYLVAKYGAFPVA